MLGIKISSTNLKIFKIVLSSFYSTLLLIQLLSNISSVWFSTFWKDNWAVKNHKILLIEQT